MTNTEHMNDGAFWDRFGRGLLSPDDRPTPQQAADFVVSLMVRLKEKEKEIAAAQHEAKCAGQQFKVFAMEVSNLANKYSR